MKNFKSPTSRLVRLFQKSRDNWKASSAAKQKRIKVLEIKIRDLTESRDYWKKTAKTTQRELSFIKNQPALVPKNSEKTTERANAVEVIESVLETSIPKGHVYPVSLISLAIQQLIQGQVSFRGCQLNFELFSPFFKFELTKTPSFSNIRNWLYRIGLYALNQPKVYRDDWILIADFVAELGKLKTLVILGIQKEYFCAPKRVFRDSIDVPSFALRHIDVEVLAVKILTNSTGKVIFDILTQLTEQIGVPIQIVADHGSDLKNGIERYQSVHPDVIYTHDITHHLGILFKKMLENDNKYQNFCQECGSTRLSIQQTSLHFLIPPSSKHKSRYLNVDKYIKWANQVFVFKSKNDYSKISQFYFLDEEAYLTLTRQVDEKTLTCLKNIESQTNEIKEIFLDTITKALGLKKEHKVLDIICIAADMGRRQFINKLGWLEDYEQELKAYTQMVTIAHQAETLAKNSGLTKGCKQQFEQNLKSFELTPQSQDFSNMIVDYFSRESTKLTDDKPLLATSDIVESLFSKYKLLTSASCLNEAGKRILILPLCTMSITYDFIKNALESVSERDVENWSKDVFGQSALSKRREAFSLPKKTQK